MEPPPRTHGEPDAAERADRIGADRVGPAGADHAVAEVLDPAGGVHDGGAAVTQQRGHRHRERVHREVARAQVGFDRRGAEIHQVDLSPARPGHDTPSAAVLVQDHEGGVEPVGEAASQLERPARDRQVEIAGGSARQELPQGAPHDPHGPRRARHLAQRNERPARRVQELIQPDAH